MDGAAARIGPRGSGLRRALGALLPGAVRIPDGSTSACREHVEENQRRRRLPPGQPGGTPRVRRSTLLRLVNDRHRIALLHAPRGASSLAGVAPEILRRPDPQPKKTETAEAESYSCTSSASDGDGFQRRWSETGGALKRGVGANNKWRFWMGHDRESGNAGDR